MKFDNIKYGLLISATTMFGGSSLKLYAQDSNKEKIEQSADYKKQFMESIAPDKKDINVEFVVDSVKNITSNGDLLADVNVIQMLAYLDENSDEYQSYMASRHIVAHEMWHRICLMKETLEKPLSASLYRNGRDNFEITANIAQLLTFRDDYTKASPEQRKELRKLKDPKIRMYVAAVEQKIINPFSQDKKEFDFEMEFIAKTVSNFWNNNMAVSYAQLHNAMTEKAGRTEFKSPVYEKNFLRDIKTMNTIGGIDFSQYYNVRDVRLTKEFAKSYQEDTAVYKIPLSAPDYETWIDKRSKLKRFSRQKINIPNFTGDRLAKERGERALEAFVPQYHFVPATGNKVYFGLKTPLYAATALAKGKETIKIYPHGAVDFISAPDTAGIAKIITRNYDGSFETGRLKNGRKEGTFIYYDAQKKEIGRCNFKNGRGQDGEMIFASDDAYIRYLYKNGRLTGTDVLRKDGVKITAKGAKDTSALSGLVPARDNFNRDTYLLYKGGRAMAQLLFNDNLQLSERQQARGNTLKIERFYNNGAVKYEALAETGALTGKSGILAPQAAAEKMAGGTNETAAKTAASRPTRPPRLFSRLQEALLTPEGKPVMAAVQQNGNKTIKLKAHGFMALLKATFLPPEEKKALGKAVLAAAQRKNMATQINKPENSPVAQTLASGSRLNEEKTALANRPAPYAHAAGDGIFAASQQNAAAGDMATGWKKAPEKPETRRLIKNNAKVRFIPSRNNENA